MLAYVITFLIPRYVSFGFRCWNASVFESYSNQLELGYVAIMNPAIVSESKGPRISEL